MLPPSSRTPPYDALKATAFVRNQVGAHYNVTGMAIADAEIEEFARLAVALAGTLSCAACGQIPSKGIGSHYAGSCPEPGGVRMLPLQL